MQDGEHPLCERELRINGYWEGWLSQLGAWGMRGGEDGVVGEEGTGLFQDLSNEDTTTNGLIK